MRRSLPSPRVTSRVRKVLEELGYVEHSDFSYEVEIRAYGNRRFLADLILFDGEVPVALIEVEGKRMEAQTGYDEASLKAIAYNPKDPIPIIWVAAGDIDQCYLAERPNDHVGVSYKLVEKSPSEILNPSNLANFLSAYLERQKGQASAGELQYRLLLERAFASFPRQKSYRERIRLIAEVLQGNLPLRYKSLKQLSAQLQALKLPQFALARAFRHLMRYYFRPTRHTDDIVKKYGIYFTPYEVIQFLVDLVDPKPEEKMIDPACGSGGFLAQVITHLVEKYQTQPNKIAHNILGYDIHDTCVLASRTLVHLMLTGGVSNPSASSIVRQGDSLLDDGLKPNSFDVVLCNPPAGDLPSDYELPEQLWYQFAGTGKGKIHRSEIAFLEMVLRITKSRARIGLILPESLLTNTNTKSLREWLSKDATIEAIIGLPRGLFPFTPSRMCAVVLTKRVPKREHRVLLAEVSRAHLREQFQEIKQILMYR